MCVCERVWITRNGRARVCHSPTVRIKQIDVGRLSSAGTPGRQNRTDARIETGTDSAQPQQQPGISRALYAVIDYYCYYFSRAAGPRAFAHSNHHFVCACEVHPCIRASVRCRALGPIRSHNVSRRRRRMPACVSAHRIPHRNTESASRM